VITEIIVNDEEKYTDLSGIFELDPENINKLSVQTASYHRLCINTLTEMLEYLSRLDEGYETIGELVENDRISEAMTILNSAVEGIEWMNTAFSKIINIMKIELTEDENTFIREYGQHLNELMQALENQDFVTVKDIVLYELKDDVASWKKLLEKYKREGEKIH
jgi:lipopolysaccharide biosynthesis regulator YciM